MQMVSQNGAVAMPAVANNIIAILVISYLDNTG